MCVTLSLLLYIIQVCIGVYQTGGGGIDSTMHQQIVLDIMYDIVVKKNVQKSRMQLLHFKHITHTQMHFLQSI